MSSQWKLHVSLYRTWCQLRSKIGGIVTQWRESWFSGKQPCVPSTRVPKDTHRHCPTLRRHGERSALGFPACFGRDDGHGGAGDQRRQVISSIEVYKWHLDVLLVGLIDMRNWSFQTTIAGKQWEHKDIMNNDMSMSVKKGRIYQNQPVVLVSPSRFYECHVLLATRSTRSFVYFGNFYEGAQWSNSFLAKTRQGLCKPAGCSFHLDVTHLSANIVMDCYINLYAPYHSFPAIPRHVSCKTQTWLAWSSIHFPSRSKGRGI